LQIGLLTTRRAACASDHTVDEPPFRRFFLAVISFGRLA